MFRASAVPNAVLSLESWTWMRTAATQYYQQALPQETLGLQGSSEQGQRTNFIR